MNEVIDLALAVSPGSHLVPTCPDAQGPVWIRPVDSATVSFTYETQSAAFLYHVSLHDGACWLVHTFERPPQTANIWKNCEALSHDGCLYTLVRYAPDRYVVTDVSRRRSIELPIRPGAQAAIDTVGDFHADEHRVVYLNNSSDLGPQSLIVACNWTGAVKWTRGLEDAFPGLYIYLWETCLCPMEDGGFLVFINGEAYPDGGASELTAGLLMFEADGTLREAFRLPWWPAIMSEAASDHIDGGGGFLLRDRPFMVAHMQESSVLRGQAGERLVIEAPATTPSNVQYWGIVEVGGRLVIGHGERGLTVHDLAGRTGLEPTGPSAEERSGFEPTL